MPETRPDDPDADLVRAAAAGDVDAFEVLVRRYQAKVVTLVRTCSGDAEEAEDLAQEVFVRVYRSLGAFRGDSAFRTWLYKVAVNVTRTHQARRRRAQPVWGDSGATDDDAFDAVDEVDLEQHLITRDAVARALSALPVDLRLAVELRDVHGLEYRDIAEATGAPMGTVESRIFRARQRLRGLLGGMRGRPATRAR